MEKISWKKVREFVIITIMIMVIQMKEICECCIDSEKNGLLEIKSAFSRNSTQYFSSWGASNGDCCTWERVFCNSATGHITRLALSEIGHVDFGDYRYLNASLFLPFEQLNELELWGNNFAGCIHNEGFERLSTLSNLEVLALRDNEFNKSILPSFRRLPSLKSLDMSHNKLIGTINISELNNPISTLLKLELGENQIEGFKAMEGFCHLKNLQHLDLKQNDLKGDLPRCLANSTSLQYLDLSDNQFSGNISVSPLPSLTSLRFLDLSDNFFEIPVSLSPFFNLSQLESLHVGDGIYADMEDHNLNPKFQLRVLSMFGHGEGGSLPNFLYHQHNLEQVSISSIGLKGEFPYWLLLNNTGLTTLDLSKNSLSGILQLPYKPHLNLSFLDLSDNFISGYIPSEIGVYIPDLIYLRFSENEFKGTIPHSLCRVTVLIFLDISQNRISGTIPECIEKLYGLEVLDLSKNNISGSLPPNLSFMSLVVLNLSKNRLSGTLNASFYSSLDMKLLDLSHNNFSGSIPLGIDRLFKLGFLVLGYNNFEGTIPVGLCKLQRLSFLDLSHNSFSGHILPCLNITSSWIDLIAQPLEITMKGLTYPYELKILNLVSGIDISCNNLTGRIPVEFGDLTNIEVLNLSHNSLRGTIPTKFSNLKDIQSLDLSCNNLQGAIPPQLTQLFRLSAFNVSYNNLSGRTPNQVAQFVTFDERSYGGNPFLCGWPLPKSCDESSTPPSNETTSLYKEESWNSFIDMEFFYVSFGISYGTVLLTLTTILCINPYWRRVWFYYVQTSINKTYYFIIDNVVPLFSKF